MMIFAADDDVDLGIICELMRLMKLNFLFDTLVRQGLR
jgi:hypothetical protein